MSRLQTWPERHPRWAWGVRAIAVLVIIAGMVLWVLILS